MCFLPPGQITLQMENHRRYIQSFDRSQTAYDNSASYKRRCVSFLQFIQKPPAGPWPAAGLPRKGPRRATGGIFKALVGVKLRTITLLLTKGDVFIPPVYTTYARHSFLPKDLSERRRSSRTPHRSPSSLNSSSPP